MKIGKPVTEVPVRVDQRTTKYSAIWKATEQLAEGESLPVEFTTLREAHSCRTSTHWTAQRKGLSVTVRGTTVYITRDGA